MIDSTKLGEIAAKCMESLDKDETLDGGELIAVAVICIAQDKAEEASCTRIFCTDEMYYRQVGLLRAGLQCVEHGEYRDFEEDE